ncbi:MAG: 30S ribosomal protein S3 [Anaerolineae bacterium]|nr:MAG: 30S ribosomal protein S3 [Anaerolineae bacterium]
MGRKVHPTGFRLKINKTWEGRWYAEGEQYVNQLHQDFEIRELVRNYTPRAGVSRVEIERFPGKIKIIAHTAKPGVLIGRRGDNIKGLRAKLGEMIPDKKVDLDIKEIKNPDLDAYLVAANIADQLERRISFQRAIKRAIQQSMRQGAKGIRIEVAGRLSGAEMARTVAVREGRVPRQTLRADIDYARAEATTTYGQIGIKVWIYKGDVLSRQEEEVAKAEGGVYVSK